MYLLPYKYFSKSARNLAGLLGAVYLNPEHTHQVNGVVINWGNSKAMLTGSYTWINKPSAITISNNKLSAFQHFRENEIQIPRFTTNKVDAQGWVNDGRSVLCRTKLSGHSGDGIVLASNEAPLVDAPLYVDYIPKDAEYRVHVAFGEVIDEQRKRKSQHHEGEFSQQIRSHANGWVYCREGILHEGRRSDLACDAVSALSLDFGAVDIIYNKKRDKYYVLEVNTAPGLEGETLYTYFNTFYSYFNHD